MRADNASPTVRATSREGAVWHQSRGARWATGVGLVVMASLAMVLLFLLAQAADHGALVEAHYAELVMVNVAVAVLLLLVIAWLALRLVQRLRSGKFGGRLLLKLAMVFALVGFLPGLVIYAVSYQFVSRSIESWFDVRVESALRAGLNLGGTALDTLASDLGNKARAAATGLSDLGDAGAALSLDRLREQLLATDAVLWGANGQVLAGSGASRFELNPQRPLASEFRAAREQGVVTSIEGLEDLESAQAGLRGEAFSGSPRVRVLVLVGAAGFGLSAQQRFLELVTPLPAALVSDALAVQVAHREYQERALARDGLRRMYIGTLTLTLFLAVFGAVLLAVLMGNQLVRPLLVLAEGMREVAAGDLRPKVAMAAPDELAGLTRTFAHMTQELADARHAVQRSMAEVDAARANLQTILDNLTAGVVVLDPELRIQAVNPGASRILRVSLDLHQGQPLQQVPGLHEWAQGVARQFERFLADGTPHEGGYWQESFEIPLSDAPQNEGGPSAAPGLTLIARGALLPGNDRLLVFDDVSEIISAQRAKAWGEVARRLAHEIKNPLTPIQLSAERLAMKLGGKVDASGQAVLDKSVRTIVEQVDAMKRLVNEFRDYARLPAAQLIPTDLNALLRDVLALYETSEVPVNLTLDPACPQVMIDPQQVRQVVHNLVQNAQDASPAGGAGVDVVTTSSASGRWVRLTVRDQGPGFAEAILKRAFEPYVTTKTKGTGLGLAVVKKIMDEHGGRIELGNRVQDERVLGAQVSLSFAVAPAQH